MSNFEKIIELTDAKPSGNGYVGLCPCHDDKTPSLSISPNPGGLNPLIHCFAGCSQENLIDHFKENEAWTFKKSNFQFISFYKNIQMHFLTVIKGCKENGLRDGDKISIV